MNLNQTFSITFRLNYSKQNSQAMIPIWARTTVDGKLVEFSTSRQVLQKHWNSETGEVISTAPDNEVINDFIINAKVETKKHYIFSLP